MTPYFDEISCGLKQMHAQFSFFFGPHNAIVLLSKLFWINKIRFFEDNPENTLRKNLTTPCLQQVSLYITYLLLRELVCQ